jgi:ssRNA-specific RNase YbeY (16S rRNA maturation enzyme)
LLGYDHMDDGEQKKQMRSREEEIASMLHSMER